MKRMYFSSEAPLLQPQAPLQPTYSHSRLFQPPPGPLMNRIGVGACWTAKDWNLSAHPQMPWNFGRMVQPDAVRFTGETPFPENFGARRFNWEPRNFIGQTHMMGNHKRKERSDLQDAPVRKQHISDEKMAAHMSQLHISNSYTRHPRPSEGRARMHAMTLPHTSMATSSCDLAAKKDEDSDSDSREEMSTDSKTGPRLVLCEEVRRLKNESILPASILQKMKEPSMALVLWKPPGGFVKDVISATTCKNSHFQSHGSATTFGNIPCSSTASQSCPAAGMMASNDMHSEGRISHQAGSRMKQMQRDLHMENNNSIPVSHPGSYQPSWNQSMESPPGLESQAQWKKWMIWNFNLR